MSQAPAVSRVSDAVRVRVGELADLPSLVEIYNHYVEHTAITFDLEPFTVEQRWAWFEQHRTSGRHRLFVAEEDGVVLGYASTHQFRVKAAYDSTVEMTVYLAPGCERRGLGARLYSALFDAVKDEEIGSFIAGMTLPNEASIALHARFGFSHVGTMKRVGRKFGRYWDVAWYERLR
ncbi:MAG TPA: GNAT family N-acetyltransferase [Polyangiales bacterium]|nr:GNAT family N-acetyltransferase [Polyangiales bacterium]